MSLADDLMADLEEEEVEDVDIENNNLHHQQGEAEAPQNNTNNFNIRVDQAVENLKQKDQDVTTENILAKLDLHGTDISSVSTLMSRLNPILEQMRNDMEPPTNIAGNIENHPTYKLLVDANNYAVEIDNEQLIVHKYIKDLYSKRFQELSGLLPHPVDYAKTVKTIGNNMDFDKDTLRSFLPPATVMIIAMSAYENKGSALLDYELEQVNIACDLLLQLDSSKSEITEYVSTRLTVFAPNVTQIVPSHTAAQIMGFVGGLSGLSRIPNANVPTLGNKREVRVGLGQRGTQRRGFLYYTDMVQNMPNDKRNQAMKLIAGKLVLAARVDLQHSSPDGSMGAKWKKEVDDRLDKLVEPPEVTKTKALPIPDEKKSKKRGGRRMRKLKEQWGQTELQRAQNRMGFNEQLGDYGDDEDEVTALSKAGGAIDAKASLVNRAKLNKKGQARLDSMNQRVQNNSEGQSMITELSNPSADVSNGGGNGSAIGGSSGKWFNKIGKRKAELPEPTPKKQHTD